MTVNDLEQLTDSSHGDIICSIIRDIAPTIFSIDNNNYLKNQIRYTCIGWPSYITSERQEWLSTTVC